MLIRAQKTVGDYFAMHKHGIENDGLSFKAKGLLAYLMSKPDRWEIRISDLCKHSPEGEVSIRSGLAELERAGYLARKREQDQHGKFVWVCIVSDTPLPNARRTHPDQRKSQPSKPSGGFPQMDNPQVDNPQMDNRYPSINDNSINESSNNEPEETMPDGIGAEAPETQIRDLLEPSSSEEILLFDLLTQSQISKNRRPPRRRFQNPVQAQTFRDAVKVLNGQTESVLRRFFVGGSGGLGNAVAYVAGAARKRGPAADIEILEPVEVL